MKRQSHNQGSTRHLWKHLITLIVGVNWFPEFLTTATAFQCFKPPRKRKAHPYFCSTQMDSKPRNRPWLRDVKQAISKLQRAQNGPLSWTLSDLWSLNQENILCTFIINYGTRPRYHLITCLVQQTVEWEMLCLLCCSLLMKIQKKNKKREKWFCSNTIQPSEDVTRFPLSVWRVSLFDAGNKWQKKPIQLLHLMQKVLRTYLIFFITSTNNQIYLMS